MAGLYFDLRDRFPWRQQLGLFRWIACGVAGWLLWIGLPPLLARLAGQPHLTPLRLAYEVAAYLLVAIIPAIGLPGLGLLLTIALWPWGRKYLARDVRR